MKYDLKMAFEIEEFPQETYKEVRMKIDIIDDLKSKYYIKRCEKLKSDWQKFED